ncbi:methyltransferase [Cedecea neteri]|uniref:protein O-GlcNAc transferase n=3 Tax=Cedecea neteri TaxID=158822 RepID=A0A291DWQ8_9ENTR|nr:methyltransferase regulatory domain-containing protein [Cedecea neteri]ATF92122.1 methyltransferase [Cedecea neteri]
MQSAAQLNHLNTVAPPHARILDIGCGEAKGIVAHALAWPESVAIGIDIDETGIAAGQRYVQALGLANVELFCAGLGDILAIEGGAFDYITIGGVFSLLAGEERAALLQWCRQNLSASGVIALQWQTLPGEHHAVELRQILQSLVVQSGAQGVDAQVAAARAKLALLLAELPAGELKAKVEEALRESDLILTLRYLGQAGEPLDFSHFCALVSENGLHYVGDVIPQYELPQHYGDEIEAACRESVDQSRTVNQQHLDNLLGRSQRFSLLSAVQGEHTPPPQPDLSLLGQFHWAGNFRRMVNEEGLAVTAHINGQGEVAIHADPLTLRVLDLLGAAWPLSLSLEQLVFNARTPGQSADVREQVLAVLTTLYVNQLPGLYWTTSPGAYNQDVSPSLRATVNPLALILEENKAVTVCNHWGESCALTAEEWRYLAGDMLGTDEASWGCFISLRLKGALSGSPQAWKKHYQRFLLEGNANYLEDLLDSLLLLSVSVDQGGLLAAGTGHEPQKTVKRVNDALYNDVNRLIVARKPEQAKALAGQLLLAHPDDVSALRSYSRCCILTGDTEEALSTLCRLMGHYFSSQEIFYDLAIVFQKLKTFVPASKILHALLRLSPNNVEYWHVLAAIYHHSGEIVMAEKCCRESLRTRKPDPKHLAMMGVILSDNQQLEEARYFLEKAQQLDSQNLDYFTSLLFVMTHDSAVSAPALFEKHREYGRIVSQWAAKTGLRLSFKGEKNPEKKLRVGFVSGDLRNHPVSQFLLPFWDGLNRDRFELVGYSASFAKDEMTEYLKAGAVLWREVYALDDVELARQINQDRIDILFDLSGHTTFNRLPAFALRPAPVQISWIGYPGTTGLSTMDYRVLMHTQREPAGLEQQLTENIMFIEMRKVFEPHADSPPVNTLPALRNGYITFGSFNRPKKINDEVLRVWASILVRYPESKLIIGFMVDEKMIETLSEKLVSFGAQASQLSFKRRAGLIEYLSYHHEIDILLDAFPYTGGTTSNHGCWMGVPTLTLCGATMAGRQGVDIMRSYGLEQFVAFSEADYISKAIGWREHFDELNEIRVGMRGKIPTENERGFNVAGTFEQALQEAWRMYCAGEAARTFTVLE